MSGGVDDDSKPHGRKQQVTWRPSFGLDHPDAPQAEVVAPKVQPGKTTGEPRKRGAYRKKKAAEERREEKFQSGVDKGV
jgi:hypothetical protein